jgi:hypothetical protein
MDEWEKRRARLAEWEKRRARLAVWEPLVLRAEPLQN